MNKKYFWRASMSNGDKRTYLRSPLFEDEKTDGVKARELLQSHINLHKKMGYACLLITKEKIV